MENLVFAPEVYVIGRQTIVQEELDRFLTDESVETWTTDTEVAGEKLVEIAGRLCYLSYAKPRPGGNKAYIDHILEVGHGSVVEHAVWNLIISGISRSLTHELVRHRAGVSPSQLSQRYVDESDTKFVVPPMYQEAVKLAVFYREDSKGFFNALTEENRVRQWQLVSLGEQWLFFVEQARKTYTDLADSTQNFLIDPSLTATERRKKAREAARSVLPNATETKIFLTCNARALRNFLELRASRHAEAEIRTMANQVYEVMIKESPNLFGDYKKIPLPDGTFELDTEHRKV